MRQIKQTRTVVLKLGLLMFALASGGPALVRADENVEALAKQSQNPVADMISMPLQNNFNFGMGPDDELGYNLNIQPVIPLPLGTNWNLIARPIMPILDIPLGHGVRKSGTGDLTLETFFTPNNNNSTLWGLGPMATFPTASSDALGAGQWNLGPSLVGVVMRGHWVVGSLVTQTWSVAGDNGRRTTSPFAVEPFINYNFSHGWAISTSPTFAVDWQAKDSTWTIPLGGGISRTMLVAKQPITVSVGAYYNVTRPQYQYDWQLKFSLTFLFPSK